VLPQPLFPSCSVIKILCVFNIAIAQEYDTEHLNIGTLCKDVERNDLSLIMITKVCKLQWLGIFGRRFQFINKTQTVIGTA